MEYQKINTLFKRDERGIIIPEKFTLPEFGWLKDCKWEATEKIDGTNMRLELQFSTDDYNPEVLNYTCRICGKTDNAQIPPHLYKKMEDLFGEVNWNEIFPDATSGECITIYGEGYGAKIQNGGNYIKDDVNFILFDVRVNDWWLNRANCEDIAKKLNIDIVPLIGYMTIPEAINYVEKGFKSTIAQNKDYDAEGLVLRTPDILCRKDGSRLITKIKTKDFRIYENSWTVLYNIPDN
jgi:ATP-dependent RNA circularization protein (DNA/RNA ligase family)